MKIDGKFLQQKNHSNYIQNIQQAMKLPFLISLIVFVCLSVESVPAMEHKKVIQSNHYYSDTDASILYNIEHVEKHRPLIFVLRDKVNSQASLPVQKNNINIGLKSGQVKAQCLFDSYDDLCVISEVGNDQKMSLQIKCSKLPCDVSWTIFQPISKNLSKSQPLQQLYSLSDSNKHMIAIVSCNDPAIKSFYTDVTIYSNNPFSVSQSNNVIYYLFNNQKKGFMFAEVKEASKHCAQLAIYNVSENVKINEKASIRDFVRNDSLSIFKLDQVPSTDFQLDVSIHELNKSQIMKSGLQLKITAENTQSKQRQTLQQKTLKPFSKKTSFDFNFIIKKVDSKFKNIQIQLKSTGDVIMINYILIVDSRQHIQLGQASYFNLKTDQKLLFKLDGDKQADNDKLAYIYPSNKQNIKLTQTKCKVKDGCEFQMTAIKDVQGLLYLGQNAKQNQQQIVYGEFKKSITKKGKQGSTHYYKTSIQPKKPFQLVANSPNVLIYIATQAHCPQIPSQKCYQKVFNYHHPTIYEPQTKGDLIVAVFVLDNCQYTLTRIDEDQDYIQLKDSQSFTYLMDDHQRKVVFKFNLDKKEQVNFNLISPLNSLYLLVQNGKKVPSTQQMNLASTDGYISIPKKQVKELQFTILVYKTQQFKHKFVHFTIIISTKQSNLRLQPGIAHYQTISPQEHRDLVFEFQPKQQYIVSFYTHNAKAKQKVNIQLMVSNNDLWKNIKEEHSFIIDRESDVLQLKDVSKELCQKQGQESCQIFIRITNSMDSEIDLTVNLMVKNSIIQLKDGIWQSYAENSIATSSNFYFYPTHENKSVQIMYKSVFTDLRISYSLWKADDKNIDPTQWPFPKQIPKQSNQNLVSLYKPTKHISIDHSALKQCWPSCVILISLINNSSQVKGQFDFSYLENGEFSIMASNNYIQIPQKTKVSLVMKEKQVKYFMIDLKYVMEKEDQAITIFTYSTIGFYDLKGNVYSQKNARCPTQDEQSDFRFGNLQTQIKLSTIQKKIQQNDMGDDRNVYICILAKAYTNTKLSIEYTSQKNAIKIMDLDTFQTVSVDKSITKMYQVNANQQYYVKFIRNKGFPFVDFVKCKEGEDYQDCLDKFVDKKDKGKQLITKTESFNEEPCAKCIIFIKISAEEPAEVDIHLQSKYTQMQLKQGIIVSDFTQQNEQNRYILTTLRNQQTIINIQITQGNLQVHVSDLNKINITKKNQKSSNLIHITIPAAPTHFDNKQFATLMGMPWMTSFGLSQTFSYLHIQVKSSDAKGATAYTITYSSGERETYLQDGLITDYVLEPEKDTTFFYQNNNKEGHGYLTISMDNSAFLHNLDLKMYYLVDGQDEDTKIQIPADKPPMRKKTPNPSVTYNLPAQNLIIIKMKNPSNSQQRVSLGINHQQVILLPFNHQFPFPLHKLQSINMLIDVNNPGYVKITVRKCDQSNPEISYTFDYQAFQKGEFTHTQVLNDDPVFQFYIKAKEVGTLYVNIKSQEDVDSLLSIKADYSKEKTKSSQIKPGNRGLIDYQLLDSATAQLTFNQASCGSDKLCKKDYQYFTISASKQQDLYTQTVCPSHYFALTQATSINPLPLTRIKADSDSNGKISFKYILLSSISYVGVKGINIKTGDEIYYRPVQIVTAWGHIQRTSATYKFTVAGVTLFVLLAILICCRRHARKGYKPLEEED